MSKKIAFLTLSYNTFQKEGLMRKFFDERYADRYNLYIHPKEDVNAASLFTRHYIPYEERVHDTEWGYFSLVEATLALLKHALQDPSNEKFILLSDSHLPLYNINTMCDILWDRAEVTSFGLLDRSLAPHRFFKMFRLEHSRAISIPFSVKNAVFSSQWFICTRDAAVKFVEAYDKYSSYFEKDSLTLADECWFGTMSNHLKIPWQNRSFCFADWDWETDQYMIDRGCKKNPHTFATVTHADVDKYRTEGNVFIRKIHNTTDVDEDYLLST